MIFNELVRDKTPALLEKEGKQVTTRQVSPEEIAFHLISTLQAKLTRYMVNSDLGLLIDMQEIIYILAGRYSFSEKDFNQLVKDVRQEFGTFSNVLLMVIKDGMDETIHG